MTSAHIGRTILALLICVSVAMLPVAGGIAAPADASSISEVMISAHDCCDHDGMPVDKMIKDCQAAAGCASKCFSLYGVIVSSPITHLPVIAADDSLVTKTFRPQIGSLPFRPPRV